MKERGMIFNGEMVRAILDGRKTQTRRIIKPQPEATLSGSLSGKWLSRPLNGLLLPKIEDIAIHCPFGVVGDRIWVRETFQGPLFDYDLMDSYCKDPTPFEKPEFCVYKADGVPAPEFYDADDELHCCWRPSIHMPRWASRIMLEITDVRVERLNSINEHDAIAEGLAEISKDWRTYKYGVPDRDGYPGTDDCGWPWHEWECYPISAYSKLWKSIYGADSWQANPWVWVIEFKRVEGGAA
ncbi:TPA: morphogenetic protein [Klebsiella pneumoniae]|uniref:morphogenetic protein n=1 Tax=Klebsiella pneumoniae TaxID=573 RepID=UPI002E19ABB2|nr:morphogenetic protein [Klebsiella pneumoniae]HBR5904892.1 morphogenetic protein [Klebsiella pneumoniae]HCQ6972239.1 morphogenetic protein [Klebsiella pneumoniae]